MSKLIIYFSLSNNTKRAALAVQKITGADIVRIEPKTPYPAEYSKLFEDWNERARRGYFTRNIDKYY